MKKVISMMEGQKREELRMAWLLSTTIASAIQGETAYSKNDLEDKCLALHHHLELYKELDLAIGAIEEANY